MGTRSDTQGAFWSRQCARSADAWSRVLLGNPSARRNAFDVLIGLVLPFVCLKWDWFVFVDPREGEPLLGFARGPVYATFVVAGLALVVVMSARSVSCRVVSVASGTVLFGAIVSLGVGVAILPWAVLGFLYVIGILGLVPLVSGIVYMRWFLLSMRSARFKIGLRMFGLLALLGFFVAVAVAVAGNFLDHHGVRSLSPFHT